VLENTSCPTNRLQAKSREKLSPVRSKIELFQRILELSMGKSLERWMVISRLWNSLNFWKSLEKGAIFKGQNNELWTILSVGVVEDYPP
jgi:hypothetical protein